jgi:hypothetical protein
MQLIEIFIGITVLASLVLVIFQVIIPWLHHKPTWTMFDNLESETHELD